MSTPIPIFGDIHANLPADELTRRALANGLEERNSERQRLTAEVVKGADEALYRAKERGRNQVSR